NPEPSGNFSLKAQTGTFLITGSSTGLLQPAVNASYGPLTVDAPIPPDLLLSGCRILPVILVRQVRSSSPVVKILFHMPAKDRAHCVTAYAFWETREVRGACLVSSGGFCVAHLKPEPSWFSATSRSGSSSKEAGKTEGIKGLQGNLVEVYFQSRWDQTGQCTPQDSLQRVGVGRGRDSGGSGTPMRRIGSVSLLRTPPGNPMFLRLRLGSAVVIQTSSKPLKTTDMATFYVFLASTSTLESFTLRLNKTTPDIGDTFECTMDYFNMLYFILLFPNRGLLEVLQLDFVPKDVSEQAESQTISWRLEFEFIVTLTLNQLRLLTCSFTAALPAQNKDILNTAVLTGKMVSVPVKALAVEADGSVTDVTNYTSCRSTEEDVLKVSEGCDYVYVNGKEMRGKSRVMLNFTYGFLSAQLEMSVWMPRLPLLIDVADSELSQIKGWRVPVSTSSRSDVRQILLEEEEEMRKGRGCMLQYQHTALRVLTSFITQADTVCVRVCVCVCVCVCVFDFSCCSAMRLCLLQVLSPLTSLVLAERTIRVLDDKVSVTELGVQLVSGLSLSLRLSPESYRGIVAMFLSFSQEALVSCWVQFSDGTVTPLELFDHSAYSLTVSTPDESVATVRRTPLSTFVVAQGEGEGKGLLVKVELRICEECQKSKRKSKLAVGMGLFKINFQTSSRGVARGGSADGRNGTGSDGIKDYESDLIRTFRAMSDIEIGMYALVGVSCVAILAFLLNCASYNLCFRHHKTPIQAGPAPSGDRKDHKHDWVWLGSNNHNNPATGAPVQVSTLKHEAHHPLETATLGRSRTCSQQQQFQAKVIDPMANRSATLLARPHRNEPLHSPTSKRNQVQFTTFTTLDIKHLAALKKNGVDLNWANQQTHQTPAEPQTPLPDIPWPVVKPLREPQ
uniref:Uncharacterized protein n=1 Tax=Mastacembelus armatus TaxID=205130 RepID=A0A3Q3L9A9_9TELE